MYNENSIKSTDNEAAEGHPPAASASEIINRESPMSKLWPFMGGVLVGTAGVVTAALVADKLTYRKDDGVDLREKTELLGLPEGKQKS